MEFDGKTIRFAPDLWVEHGGVEVGNEGGRITLEGTDEDSYVKVFNHFGRVLKLFTFEGGRWIDGDTGLEAKGLDESQAGRIPGAGFAAKAAHGQSAAKDRARTTGGGKAAGRIAAAENKPGGVAKRSGGKASSTGKAPPAGAGEAKPTGKGGSGRPGARKKGAAKGKRGASTKKAG